MMEVYILVIPATIALLIKLYIICLAYGNKSRSRVFTPMLAIFAVHNLCEVIAYIYFFHGSIADWHIRTYYGVTIFAMLYMCLYAIEVSNVEIERKITLYCVVAISSLTIIFSDLIISGVVPMGYTLTALHGSWYWIFQFSVLASMFFIGFSLLKSYVITNDPSTKAQCFYTMLAMLPLLMAGPAVIFLQHIGWQINSSLILPIASTFYLIIITLSEKQHHLTDMRTSLFFSTDRKIRNRLLQLYSNFSTLNYGYKDAQNECERAFVEYSLEKNKHNVSKTAEMMQINRSTFYSMCKRLNIDIHKPAE